MSKNTIIKITTLLFCIISCMFVFVGCSQNPASTIEDTVQQDSITTRVMFGKKYYYLGYENYTKNEYYTFYSDGTATYTHIMQDGNTVTFHQVINFNWAYAGEGDCILVHNGTDILKGAQDDAFGFGRVMHLSNSVVYWTASGENTYYVCEDFISKLTNYGSLNKSN